MSEWQILHGDVRERLKDLQPQSVQCVVTSPPYFGLRDYGVPGQIGMEATPGQFTDALVDVFGEVRRALADDGTIFLNLGDSYNGSGKGGVFTKASAKQATNVGANINKPMRLDCMKPKDLIGVPWMVAFALRDAGWYLRSDIIWSKPNPMPESVTDRPTKAHEYLFLLTKSAKYYYNAAAIREPYAASTLQQFKVPYDGEATKDYEGAGVQNPSAIKKRITNKQRATGKRTYAGFNDRWDESVLGRKGQVSPRNDGNEWNSNNGRGFPCEGGANKRSVWTIPTQPYPECHFATFPEALVEPCILAGSRGPGKRCDCDEVIETPLGSGPNDDPTLEIGRAGFSRPRRPNEGTRPITRREQRSYAEQMRVSPFRDAMATAAGEAFAHYIRTDRSGARPLPPALLADFLGRGWLKEPEPCRCPIYPGDLILDPFCGSGTTGAVAIRLQRNFVGIELNEAYVQLARKRIRSVAPLLAQEIA